MKTHLLSNNPQFRAFASSIDYGIIVGSKEGKIVDFNDAALEIFGYAEDELRNKPISIIMPERFREVHTNGMARYNRTKKPHNLGKTMRLYGLTKEGVEIPIEIALSSWKDVDGETYFTASLRKYSRLENNLGLILTSAGVMTVVMTIALLYLAARTF